MLPHFVILAAGMGTRLGKAHPKCLTWLDTEETIMDRQIHAIRAAFGKEALITIVVGFKFPDIMQAFPDENYIYNDLFDKTNTSKSLLKALTKIPTGNGVVWLNGDVVFDDNLMVLLKDRLDVNNDCSLITTTSASVAEEEVKYTLNDLGFIDALSKIVPTNVALGEAVGINYVSGNDVESLITRLYEIEDTAYFERGIELSIQNDGKEYVPFDITIVNVNAVEVDFEEDLVKANATFQ